MNKKQLAKKYNDTPERKHARCLLWRWGRVQEFCKQTNSEIRYFQDLADEVSDLRAHTQIKVSGGKTSDPTATAAQDLEKLQNDYESCVTKGMSDVGQELQFKTTMDEVMQTELLPEDREILTLRYKKGWSWLMVATKMHMAERTARKRDQAAVDKIAKKLSVIQKSTV